MFDSERVIQIFFFGFLAVIAYELYLLLQPFLAPLAWAILLAFVVHPLLIELDRLVKRRTLSAVIITVGVALGVILPAVYLSGLLAGEAQRLYTQVSGMLNDGGLNQARDWMTHSDWIASINRRLALRELKLEDQLPKVAMQAA